MLRWLSGPASRAPFFKALDKGFNRPSLLLSKHMFTAILGEIADLREYRRQ